MVHTVGDVDAPRSVWFLHGVLGQGRNWRSFASRAIDGMGAVRAVLPDLRNHGAHPPRPGPHTLRAAAQDLEALTSEHGPPDLVVGHSLGGKVALQWLGLGTLPAPTRVWVLDAAPGVDRMPTELDPAEVLAALRAAPMPAPSREPVRAHLREQGLPEPIVMWLLTSAERRGDGWHWMYDLDGVDEMLHDFRRSDLWHIADSPRVDLVMAEHGGRWSPTERERAAASAARFHTVLGAGHWLHVDKPAATLELLRDALQRRG